jgi:cytochrome c peroxidase
MDLFFSERAECFHCHVGFNFTNNGFHNNGIAPDHFDAGRAAVTERVSDEGKFKVPSLRNVAVTAPYMHDGSIATLDEVVEHYDRGGLGHPNTDPTIHPLHLSDDDKRALVAFLEALTDEDFLADPRFQPE